MASATRLSDSRTLSPTEWQSSLSLGREIVAMVDEREEVIHRRNLDRTFCVGGGAWAAESDNHYHEAYRLMRTLQPEVISRLRLFSHIFSGWSMLHQDNVGAGAAPKAFVATDREELAPEPPDHLILHWRKITHDVPETRKFRPPLALGELGWHLPDEPGTYNYETCVYQERVTLLQRSGILDRLGALGRPPRILEIGAGYGALAYALTSAFPSAEYTICDLPESLLFSGLYLALAGQRHVTPVRRVYPTFPAAIEVVPNYLFSDLVESGRSYDLAINTLSMSEMSDYQISTYGDGLVRLLGRDGVFFEQNFNNRHVGEVYTYSADVLGDVFPCCETIETGDLPITQGPARLWSTSPVEP